MVPETGHQKAAEAIMKASMHMNPQVDCIGIDAGNQAYPILGSMVNRMYLQLIQRAPFVWDYLYDNPDVEQVTREMRQLFTVFSSFRTKKLLRDHRPDAVICTQAMPAIAMAAHKRKGHLRVPLIAVITDFGIHAYWYQQEVDLYLVAHEEIKKEMIQRGIHENKIKVTGIPVDPKFGETLEQSKARARLRINSSKRTILVMGGSHGLGSLDDIVGAIRTIPSNFQALIVCGRNRSLLKKVTKLTRGLDHFHVIGYSKDMATLMTAADVLITKPGGLTTSEALAKQLPMILTNPIPGQEERNVKFLTAHGVARVVRTSEDLIHQVNDLLRHPKKTHAMKQRARIIGKPYSAWEAARSIFSLVGR